MEIISIKTSRKEELLDITFEVQSVLNRKEIKNGICCIYTPHTTAAITINENADPSVVTDFLKGLSHLKLESVHYNHGEGNSPSHIKSSLVGCSEMVCIENSKLQLGTWQGIYFCEFDGPRTRKVYIQILQSS